MTQKRLGRPRDTNSDDTRERVLLAARECFGNFGYDKTTNKDIATAAGITTGAIYHYFGSKQDLFGAVMSEVTDLVFDEFGKAAAPHESFVDKLTAVFEAASRLHAEDHSLARFSATFPIELGRHPELVSSLAEADMGRATEFFSDLAQGAADRHELPDGISASDAANMILAVSIGLALFGSFVGSSAHRGAVEALERVFNHGLRG